MLTLPLLRVFLNDSIIAFRLDGSILRYFTFNGEHQIEHQINIYEFMHNCKVFAWESAGVAITSSIARLDDPLIGRKSQTSIAYWVGTDPYIKNFVQKSELSSILQACEFIIDNNLLKAKYDTTTN